VLEASDQMSAARDADVVVAITPDDAAAAESAEAAEKEAVGRFRRRFERFRGTAEEPDFSEPLDDEEELRLQLMLLREENARLTAARNKPADPGTLIDQIRLLNSRSEASDVLDETWSILGDCLALREGLDQACVEIQAAVSNVRERLGKLAAQIDAIGDDASRADAKRTSLSA
jgi:hypothetical protein